MTPSKLTEIKNAAAAQLGFLDFEDYQNITESFINPQRLKFIDRVAELSYAEAMREVRDKLLDIQKRIESSSWTYDNKKEVQTAFNEGSFTALKEVKKLLIP